MERTKEGELSNGVRIIRWDKKREYVEPREDGLGMNCSKEIKQGRDMLVFTGFGK